MLQRAEDVVAEDEGGTGERVGRIPEPFSQFGQDMQLPEVATRLDEHGLRAPLPVIRCVLERTHGINRDEELLDFFAAAQAMRVLRTLQALDVLLRTAREQFRQITQCVEALPG